MKLTTEIIGGESFERDYAETLTNLRAAPIVPLVDELPISCEVLLTDDLDRETGCTAAEMNEEETGCACPVEREICDGVRAGRPMREDAVYLKGKVA